MLTGILLYYNHVIAASMMFLAINDHITQDSLSSILFGGNQQSIGFVTAETGTQNYYTILGVKTDATKHEIHKAFRQLAKKYHPDKNKDKGAQDEFIKIFKAYETLSDEKKRKDYDEQLNHGRANDFTNSHANNYQQYPGFDLNDFFKQYEDQFFRHQQHHDSHHHNSYHHDKFTFQGVNLDDLFHDIDDDELNSFDGFHYQQHFQHHHANHHHHHQAFNGHFGDGDSFFRSYLPDQIQDTLYQQQTYQSSNHRSCQTVTRQVNGVIMTQTSCS